MSIPDARAAASAEARDGARRVLLSTAFAGAGVALLLLLTWRGLAGLEGWDGSFLDRAANAAPKMVLGAFLREFVLNPWFYGVFVVVLLLERWLPARPQPGVSRGLRQDLLWAPFEVVMRATVLPLYLLGLRWVYDTYLAFLTIEGVAAWPWLARLLLALLASDLVAWITHVLRHKISALWHFHAVHHSQRDLNFFTEYRVHPLDQVFAWTLAFVPLFMVDHSFATVLAVVWIRHWHTRLYHSNIRSDFGLLRYVLVTPQSHRVHHSVELRHRDTNFGLSFSIWDHLFGTQYRGYDEYPETGIADPDFPSEHGEHGGGLGGLLEQLLYPFAALARR